MEKIWILKTLNGEDGKWILDNTWINHVIEKLYGLLEMMEMKENLFSKKILEKSLGTQEYAHLNLVKIPGTHFIFWGNFAQQIQIYSYLMYLELNFWIWGNIKYLNVLKMG